MESLASKLATKLLYRHGGEVITIAKSGNNILSTNIGSSLWERAEDGWMVGEKGYQEQDLVYGIVKRKGWLRNPKDPSLGYWITRERLVQYLRDEKLTRTLLTSNKFGL